MAEGAVSRTIELSSPLPPSIPRHFNSEEIAKTPRKSTRRNEERKKRETRGRGVIRARAFLFFQPSTLKIRGIKIKRGEGRNKREKEREREKQGRRKKEKKRKKRIKNSTRTRHTIRSTGARVLTRIRPRTLAPYDALTHSVVKPCSPSGQTHPAGNYYDKLRAETRLSSPSPC